MSVSLYLAMLRQHLRSLRLRHFLLTFLEYLVYLVLVLVAFFMIVIFVAIPHVKALVGLADPIEECYGNTLFQELGYARDICRWNSTLVLAIESVICVLSIPFMFIIFFVARPLRFSPSPVHPSVAKFSLIIALTIFSLSLLLYVLVPLYYYLAYPP